MPLPAQTAPQVPGGNETGDEPAAADGDNVLRDRRFNVPVAGLHTTADGACSDEMWVFSPVVKYQAVVCR